MTWAIKGETERRKEPDHVLRHEWAALAHGSQDEPFSLLEFRCSVGVSFHRFVGPSNSHHREGKGHLRLIAKVGPIRPRLVEMLQGLLVVALSMLQVTQIMCRICQLFVIFRQV